jgi:hypothetical protein
MEKRLRNQLWRIPLLVTYIFAVVYTIIFLILGYMPSNERALLFNREAYILGDFLAQYQPQFGISGWWDLAIVFISAFISVKMFHCFNENLSSKDDITKLQGLKMILTLATSLFTLIGFLAMWVVEGSATETSRRFTTLFLVSATCYLIFIIIMPIIIRALKSKPAVALFNWAMDR